MPSMTDVKCICGTVFQARTADVNRGWGKFCSKSCKAHKQTKDTGIAGPDYRAGGKSVHNMKSGNYAKSQFSGKNNNGRRGYLTNVHYEEWDDEVINGDVFYSHKHRCWVQVDFGDDPLIDAHPFDSEAAGFNNT